MLLEGGFSDQVTYVDPYCSWFHSFGRNYLKSFEMPVVVNYHRLVAIMDQYFKSHDMA